MLEIKTMVRMIKISLKASGDKKKWKNKRERQSKKMEIRRERIKKLYIENRGLALG